MLEVIRARTDDFRFDVQGNHHQLAVEGLALKLILAAYIEGAAADAEPLQSQIFALAPDDPLMWAWCENIMIVIQEQRGDFAASRDAIARSQDIYDSLAGSRFASSWLRSHEVLLNLGQGAMRAAAELSKQAQIARPRSGPQEGGDLAFRAITRICLAAISYERNFSERSADNARQALDQLGNGEAWATPYAIVHELSADVATRRGRGKRPSRCHREGAGTARARWDHGERQFPDGYRGGRAELLRRPGPSGVLDPRPSGSGNQTATSSVHILARA